MKRTIATILALVTLAGLQTASAAGLASDNAADTAYNDGWQTGDNGGSGWGSGWTLYDYPTYAGYFVGTSQNNGFNDGNIDTSGRAWGEWANGGAFAQATRFFSGTLSVGQSFVIDVDNGLLDSGSWVGFTIGASSNPYTTDSFSFFFRGGESTYKISNGGMFAIPYREADTGVPFTSAGVHVEFTLTGTTSYSVAITPAGGSTTVLNGTLYNSDFDNVGLYNTHAGPGSDHDAFFNSIAIIPEPTTFALVGMGLLGAVAMRKWSS
jgi:hypothetical protein